ncbi:MAG: hypothetical protein IJG38_12455 [Thermoguttaceae bacterium]|nr:hypothetical protein [Thermoguttaceae bacterium]
MFKRVLLTSFVLVLVLLPINVCYSYQSEGNRIPTVKSFAEGLDYFPPCVSTIKSYAEKIHHFPLYSLHGFLSLSAISDSGDNFFYATQSCPPFYQFTKFALNASDQDRREAINYLPQAKASERALILYMLYCSLNTQYLPIIADYLNDREIAFYSIRGYDKIEKLPYQLQLSPITLNEYSPITMSRLECDKSLFADWADQLPPSGISMSPTLPGYAESNIRVLTIARMALQFWGIKIEYSPWDGDLQIVHPKNVNPLVNAYLSAAPITQQQWNQFYSSDVRLQYYVNRYFLRVEAGELEDYDRETKKFLKEIEKLPFALKVEVYLHTSLMEPWFGAKQNTLSVNKNVLSDLSKFLEEGKLTIFTARNYPYPITDSDYVKQRENKKYLSNTEEFWTSFLGSASTEELRQFIESVNQINDTQTTDYIFKNYLVKQIYKYRKDVSLNKDNE